MNFVLAQIKKDILCQKWPLIAWAICLTVGIVSVVILGGLSHVPKLDMSNQGEAMGVVLSVAALLMVGIGAMAIGMFLLVPILVVLIVQEDPLMGTTTFWRTRPIPREQLMAAKAILIAILPLPLLFIGGPNARINDSHGWLTELAVISGIAAVAAVTSGFRGLFLCAAALLFGKGILTGIMQYLWSYVHTNRSAYAYGETSPFTAFTQTLHANAPDILHFCYFAGFAAAFVHQYLTLRTWASLAIVIGTVVGVSILQVLLS